jgi:hypothetical protein
MNSVARNKRYSFHVERDGKRCNFCKRTPPQVQLVVDHKDNNKSNNIIENTQLLCRRCNYIKNPREPVDECVSENKSEDMSELQIKQKKNPEFTKLLLKMINDSSNYEVPQDETLDTIAKIIDMSQVTLKRYLLAECSEAGILERFKGSGKWKIRYKMELSFSDKEEMK